MDKIQYINKHLEKLQGKFFLKSEAFADAIISGIRENEIKKGDVLPPINKAVEELNLSRKAIYTGYNILKERGIVGTRERIGYYIASENIHQQTRILLIMLFLSPYLRTLYHSMSKRLEGKAMIDLTSHYANPKVLSMILNDTISQYDKIVVSGFTNPAFKKEIKKIPPEKLILFSRSGGYKDAQNYYLQDFHKGTYHALQKEIDILKKYKNLYLIYESSNKNFPNGIILATKEICEQYGLTYRQINKCDDIDEMKDSLFFTINDDDLVRILELIEDKKLVLGKDAGIISYNETSVKRVIRQGITTISVDFAKMGEMIADSILSSENNQVYLETKMIKRASI